MSTTFQTTTENGQIGYARNTASMQSWLNGCAAVIRYEEASADVLVFEYDPVIEVTVIPPGVSFDDDPSRLAQ